MLLHHHNPFHAMESCLQLNGISLTPSLLHQTLICLRHSSKIALSLFHYSLSLPSSPPTSAAYNLMIDIHAQVHQFDVCCQLIIQMGQQNDEDSDSQPNFTTFSILIRRLIAARFTRQAIRAFDDMQGFIGSVDSTHFCFLLDTSHKPLEQWISSPARASSPSSTPLQPRSPPCHMQLPCLQQ
ncbi:unnamed protein product [Linum trigynum]|uniref:Pentatricopeptide repeat-containing protein n=1 Tax=Linum trigynum TaxID=586398 RepID=A0AAV2F360_9ROSI